MRNSICIITSGDLVAFQQNFEAEFDIDVKVQAYTSDETIAFAQLYNPHMVNLKSEESELECIETARQILNMQPNTKTIIIAADNSCSYTTEVVEMGGSSYLPKNINSNGMLDAVQTVANDEILYYF